MTKVLLLSPSTLCLGAPPGEAHDHSYDDSDLNSSNDSSNEDVVQLLTTGHHIQDVEVQKLITLRTTISCLTSAGGQVVSHLTLAVFTELGVVFRTGGVAVHKPLTLTRLGHSIDVWFGLHAVIFPAFILATSHVFDVDLELFEAGSFADMAGRVVGDAITATHWVVVVAVTHNVTHAEHVFRVFITFSSKLAVSTFRGLFTAT